VGDRTHIRPGFPIRTPSDHSSFDSSPRPFAVYHVLHRLLVPRHPPCALKNLATKMLASTVQISNTHRLTTQLPTAPDDLPKKTRYADAERSGSEEDNGRPLVKENRLRCFLRTQQCVTVCDVPPMSAGAQTCAGTNRTALRYFDQRHDGRPTNAGSKNREAP
jgi:hypothetical protein